MKTINDLVSLALEEVGYLEKETNAQLDSKTANAGDENFTKYQRDMDNISGFYNGKKQGYSWCDVFVDWCFVQTFGVDEALRLLCQPKKSMGAGCDCSAGYYKSKGQFFTKPQVGDQIFFKSKSYSFAHTGLVVAVDSSKVYTVEGNTSGASGVIGNGGGVCKKSYALNYANIVGYGRPAWTAAEKVGTTNATTATVADRNVTVNIRQLKKGMTGNDVKMWQTILAASGYSCGSAGADGDFGTGTETATKKFQAAKKIGVDGIVGAASWSAALAK